MQKEDTLKRRKNKMTKIYTADMLESFKIKVHTKYLQSTYFLTKFNTTQYGQDSFTEFGFKYS